MVKCRLSTAFVAYIERESSRVFSSQMASQKLVWI